MTSMDNRLDILFTKDLKIYSSATVNRNLKVNDSSLISKLKRTTTIP